MGKAGIASENILPFSDTPRGRKSSLSGKRSGRLVAINPAGRLRSGSIAWKCKCDCGNFTFVSAHNISKGRTKSCGCLGREVIIRNSKNSPVCKETHGQSRSGIYGIWGNMIYRCRNKNSTSYYRYGGRGIKVCKRWMKFENFYADMGDRPSSLHSLDRIDSEKGYSPSNCRWATQQQQTWNRRKKRNQKALYKGVSKRGKSWQARIWNRLVGKFKTAKEAALAYDAAVLAERGEYAWLNFPGRAKAKTGKA